MWGHFVISSRALDSDGEFCQGEGRTLSRCGVATAAPHEWSSSSRAPVNIEARDMSQCSERKTPSENVRKSSAFKGISHGL